MFTAALDAVLSAVRGVPADGAIVKSLTDTELLDAQRAFAGVRSAINACAALVGGEVGTAVNGGTLTVEAAKAISSGLGEPTPDAAGPGVSVEDLAGAARALLREAPHIHADQLFRRARPGIRRVLG